MKTDAPLSARCVNLLQMLADGDTSKVIARRLGLADSTIRNERKVLYRKMGVRNGHQAVAVALRNGWIQ